MNAVPEPILHPLLRSTQFNRPGPYGHEYDNVHGSAYGTDHPVDIQLGAHRRLSTLASLAKGKGME